ncbi:hypothetical protein PGT21_014988 [Puccinia graminis f. sp. tritici]|uniref:Uncharacterized protein n=1 Tax=Puccinia graminis f. sp. tritici TaxID=56615 RepID=A0A5B0S1E0_PUCGR|nr:hypothetical protein PGT21_014988 [Puccinia graminis f. sp. tritici]KAA1131582.1 hypothetical protein PGTUg99_032076 [Puccinia graminis f. sp. tritici]
MGCDPPVNHRSRILNSNLIQKSTTSLNSIDIHYLRYKRMTSSQVFQSPIGS